MELQGGLFSRKTNCFSYHLGEKITLSNRLGLCYHISGLLIYYISIWMVWYYYWDHQMKANQEKKIQSLSSQCNQLLSLCPIANCHLFYIFIDFNCFFFVFFAYMGLLSSPASWQGQILYFDPAITQLRKFKTVQYEIQS